jgi:hypothetical protein
VCYPYTLQVWLSRFYPQAGYAQPPSKKSVAGAVAACAAVALLVLLAARRSWRARRSVLVFAAGFSGMLLEGAMLLAYQTRRGILYQDLGLLIMLFMGGLAAGSLAVDAAARRAPSGPGRRLGAPLALGTSAVAALSAWALSAGVPGGMWLVAPLLAASGFTTGGLFAYASLRDATDQPRSVAPLYAADLLGGCSGSLLGSLLLIPFLGLPATGIVVTLLALALLIVV